jgi:hypothetical protein
MGSRYGAVETELGLEGNVWLAPNIGAGLRLGANIAGTTSKLDRAGTVVEPELIVRTTPSVLARRAFAGLSASVGAGPAWLQVTTPCEFAPPVGARPLVLAEDHDHGGGGGCTKVIARSRATAGSATAGAYLDVWHVSLLVGLRATANTSGDASVGLVVSAGGTF